MNIKQKPRAIVGTKLGFTRTKLRALIQKLKSISIRERIKNVNKLVSPRDGTGLDFSGLGPHRAYENLIIGLMINQAYCIKNHFCATSGLACKKTVPGLFRALGLSSGDPASIPGVGPGTVPALVSPTKSTYA